MLHTQTGVLSWILHHRLRAVRAPPPSSYWFGPEIGTKLSNSAFFRRNAYQLKTFTTCYSQSYSQRYKPEKISIADRIHTQKELKWDN